MAEPVLYMDRWTFAAVCGPPSSLGLCGSLFFIYCLISSREEQEGFKPPLEMIVRSLVGTNCLLQIVLIVHICKEFLCAHWVMNVAVVTMNNFALGLNMASSAWGSVFYYTQIMPARHKFFIWLKRNIKAVVYYALALAWLSMSIVSAMNFFVSYKVKSSTVGGTHTTTNSSAFSCNITQDMSAFVNSISVTTELVVLQGLLGIILLLALAIHTAAITGVVCYLWGHIKNMEASGTSPQLQGQIRLAITGVVHGFLYLLVTVVAFTYLALWIGKFHSTDPQHRIKTTVISVYSFGDMVSLAVSQSLFRLRFVAMLKSVRGWFPTQECQSVLSDR